MKLGDLRKFAIRQQTRIRFSLANGLECVVNESIPDFNLEQELAAAQQFHLDALTADPKTPIKTRALRREDLAALTGGAATVEVHDRDDE